jgi:hypothetical protein
MYLLCDGCGRLIAEAEAGQVVVKHRGREMRIVTGELVCACGRVTRIQAGMAVREEEPVVAVEIVSLFA